MILLWSMLAPKIADAGDPKASAEYSLKAAFIYNFLLFTDWPDEVFSSKNAPLIIGVYGKNPFAFSLEQIIQGERIKERKVIVITILHISEIKNCHVLFIPRTEADTIDGILSMVQSHKILTISEIQKFAERGGCINFYEEGKKLRFEINLKAVKHAGIMMHSNLLRLAKIVDSVKYEN